jgi:hypothetical protein
MKKKVFLILLGVGIVLFLAVLLFTRKTKQAKNSKNPKNSNYPTVFENMITKEEGDYILQKCENLFVEDKSFESGIPVNRGRTSTCILSKSEPTIEQILRKVCGKVGKDYDDVEDIEIVKYKPNGIHLPHYDSRKTTVTLFLNDSFEEGEIYFPHLREKWRPRKNGGICFQTDKNPDSLHQNIPVTKGEKYVAYIWI